MRQPNVWVYMDKRWSLKYEPQVTPKFRGTNKGISEETERQGKTPRKCAAPQTKWNQVLRTNISNTNNRSSKMRPEVDHWIGNSRDPWRTFNEVVGEQNLTGMSSRKKIQSSGKVSKQMQVFPTGGCGVKGVCSLVNFIGYLFADRT